MSHDEQELLGRKASSTSPFIQGKFNPISSGNVVGSGLFISIDLNSVRLRGIPHHCPSNFSRVVFPTPTGD